MSKPLLRRTALVLSVLTFAAAALLANHVPAQATVCCPPSHQVTHPAGAPPPTVPPGSAPTGGSTLNGQQASVCADSLPTYATNTRELTQWSVNVGVVGPNVYIWQSAEIVITNSNLYGFVVGYVNTDGSTASGPFVAGGVPYVGLAQFEPNILIMEPLDQTTNWHFCWIPPVGQAPHPVWS
jgi:hypothetical protein